ncbi:hypothetical protein YYC_02293 [Plasmodium yoelii 17X]|uniref:ATP synthase-associated protein n=4 Tax=Plasmodium yoelii TaxID=5861 RepID=A0AAF0B1A7_PLAYO|nr:ATP synthase-associated protein, putative [Plasmodium yoelii]ETB60671.1 hypothetical protein YYC_02293 [Plasmodium yoelii 17X]WBY54721.1 ATP synthase-associated protein [Plasmodium yoelii yoelii]CDU16088.1 conserved Plasmodium protein, unknown function [Plasmodium yoelii]VTZ71713.1 ATP synthase-associated protein, putative [Plasmodium yoelii]|eukprot:XP_727256.2 ATP synthase-associated protein, putative [Plasmodium yoelii]
MYRRYIWSSIFRDVNYRFKKLYHSFYYAQSHIKYVMLILFPGVIWSTRYRADTKLGYFFYINDEKLYPRINDDNNNNDNYIDKYMNYTKKLVNNQKWVNGTKFYLNDDITVQDAKKIIYKNEENIPKNIKLGCKGRMMDDNDNLALAVRAFCKRDPKIIIWEDEHAQFV